MAFLDTTLHRPASPFDLGPLALALFAKHGQQDDPPSRGELVVCQRALDQCHKNP
jgi:hypothetical protein